MGQRKYLKGRILDLKKGMEAHRKNKIKRGEGHSVKNRIQFVTQKGMLIYMHDNKKKGEHGPLFPCPESAKIIPVLNKNVSNKQKQLPIVSP